MDKIIRDHSVRNFATLLPNLLVAMVECDLRSKRETLAGELAELIDLKLEAIRAEHALTARWHEPLGDGRSVDPWDPRLARDPEREAEADVKVIELPDGTIRLPPLEMTGMSDPMSEPFE